MSAYAKFRAALDADPRVQQGRDWYKSLPARDQLIVRALGVLILLALVFLIFIAPLIQDHRELQKQLDSKMSFYNLMAENGGRFATGSAGATGKPLLATVNTEAKSHQLALTRYEQDGSSLRVWLDNVSFDDAIRWMESLSRTQGIQASQVNIDRNEQPGRVDVRATFEAR